MGSLALWIEEVIQGEKQGWAPTLYRFLMIPCSQLFRFILLVRHLLYDYKVLSVYKAPIPVISVGNLSVGGTGKTELTSFLVSNCFTHHKVAILSRGQGRSYLNSAPFRVDPNVHTLEDCGDEPWLLAKRHPEALVVVAKDRCSGARFAHTLGAKLVLLDDGMQHRRLERDIEIVILKGKEHKGDKEFLPRGTLRELPSRLKKADYIFTEGKILPELPSCSKAPIICFNRVLESVLSCIEEKPVEIKGKQVALFCGISQPRRFEETVRKSGAEVIDTLWLLDHVRISPDKLRMFFDRAIKKGAQWIVCTEKDRMKFPKEWMESYAIAFIRQKLEIVSNSKSFEEMKRTLCQRAVS